MARALAVSGKGEAPVVQDVVVPPPGAGQVRTRVTAASVNGIDAYAGAGYLWDVMPHEFPVVLGRDFAGTVEAVGDGVDDLVPGQRVAGVVTRMSLGAGTIGTEAVVDASSVVAVPDAVSDAQAAAVGLVGVAAGDLVDALELGPDDVVLVSGATGGVGSLAVQLAAAAGATVLATAGPGNDGFVRDLGAAHAVDHTADLASAVAAVAPDGVTAVVHAAGDPAVLAALLRPGGRLASSLGASAEQVGRDDVTVTPVVAVATADKLRSLLARVADGTLVVPVSRTFAFGDAADALAAFGGGKTGKLVITIP